MCVLIVFVESGLSLGFENPRSGVSGSPVSRLFSLGAGSTKPEQLWKPGVMGVGEGYVGCALGPAAGGFQMTRAHCPLGRLEIPVP